MLLLVLAFVAVPLAELYVIIEVGRAIGAAETLVLVLAISVAGAWLAKRQGLAVVARLRSRLDAGELPGREVVDGALVLVAGALLLTPGFITDAVALALLVPPVRAGARGLLFRRWRRRLGLDRVGRVPTVRVVRTRTGPAPPTGTGLPALERPSDESGPSERPD